MKNIIEKLAVVAGIILIILVFALHIDGNPAFLLLSLGMALIIFVLIRLKSFWKVIIELLIEGIFHI